LLAPKDSLAEKSRFVTRVGHLPDNANAAQWLFAFAAMVKAVSPRIVFPGDDMSFRLLQLLVTSPPPGMQPAMQETLVTLVRESLGDPAYYVTSVDKAQLPPAAVALGIEMAPFVVVSNVADARRFAADCGYPVVVKRSHSTAGDGVAICAGVAELEQAFIDLPRRRRRFSASPARRRCWCRRPSTAAACSTRLPRGTAGCWPAGRRKKSSPIRSPRARRPSCGAIAIRSRARRRRSCRSLRDVRTCSTSNSCSRRDAAAILIQINRRIPPGTHNGTKIGIDLGAALLGCDRGRPSPTRADLDDNETGYNVHFPQEWLRDPNSDWLRKHPVDVPWDEPELFEAHARIAPQGMTARRVAGTARAARTRCTAGANRVRGRLGIKPG
jgi:hypothetical protein